MLFLLRLLQCIDNGSTHSFSAQMLAEDTPLLVDGYDERNTTELIFVHRFPSRIGSQQLYPLHLLIETTLTSMQAKNPGSTVAQDYRKGLMEKLEISAFCLSSSDCDR